MEQVFINKSAYQKYIHESPLLQVVGSFFGAQDSDKLFQSGDGT